MGSDEAGAASALTRLGSEPCGASRGYDSCGLPSRAPNRFDGVVVGAEPAAVPMRMPRRTRTAWHGSGADTERGRGS